MSFGAMHKIVLIYFVDYQQGASNNKCLFFFLIVNVLNFIIFTSLLLLKLKYSLIWKFWYMNI